MIRMIIVSLQVMTVQRLISNHSVFTKIDHFYFIDIEYSSFYLFDSISLEISHCEIVTTHVKSLSILSTNKS